MSAKITDLLNKNGFSYSLEVTPEVPHDLIEDLTTDPLFFSVTWHAKSHKCEDLNIAPVTIAKYLRSKGKQVLLHLSCDMLRKDYLDKLLNVFQENGICNLFVISGERYDETTSDFKSSQELVTYIRLAANAYFCIGVAGSPGHSGDKLFQLKEKIDNGADFILTQAFFEKYQFTNFVKSCEDLGITVPIIPGVFLFENFKQLHGFINLCKVKVSNELLEQMNSKKEVEQPGLDITKKLLHDITTETGMKHFHFFTLNKLHFVSEFVKELSFLKAQ